MYRPCGECGRRATLVLLAGSVGSIAAAGVQAQTVEEYERRVAELAGQWERAVVAEHSVIAGEAQRDTLRFGTLTLVTTPSLRRTVESAGTNAWDGIRLALASDTTMLMGKTILALKYRTRMHDEDEAATWVVWVSDTSETLARRIARDVAQLLMAELDEDTRRWLGNELPLEGAFTVHDRALFVELATGELKAAHDCYSGDLSVCGLALGVLDAEDPFRRLYQPSERRELVRQHGWVLSNRMAPVYAECTVSQSDEACLEWLRTRSSRQNLLPLSASARRHFAQTALGIGGGGAYTRLAAGDLTPIGQRLAAAAGIAVDSLLVLWHQKVIAARPDSTLITARLGLTALVWIILLALVAMRSSRWRLD
jgi:hypothetical protein